jgi:DNA-binding transcriptional MerR regulator/methylmalonyl-CoA mutase cobalamin-binding subunit
MDNGNGDRPRHPIRVVSRRTGLTPALLRAWEKRYGVVSPSRSEGGQRLYSDADVHRLSLLHRVVEEGRAISQVAPLSVEELEELAQEDQVERVVPPAPESLQVVSVAGILDQANRAIKGMDPRGLERILTRGSMALPIPVLIDDVLLPLLAGIGASWEAGELGPAQEHIASVVIRRFLEWLLGTVSVEGNAPVLVAATPAGERHELGALLAAVSAAAEGWRAVFLGPDLPADEITAAALRLQAEIVALSLVDPKQHATAPAEIEDLRRRLPSSIQLVVGGPSYLTKPVSERVAGVRILGSMKELRNRLSGLAPGYR